MTDRRYVVTGALGALGAVVVRRLAQEGTVVALDQEVRAEPLQGAALEIGGVDLSEPAVVEAAFARIGREFGPLDGLVNIAGTFRWETLEQGSVDTWDLLYRVNLRTAVVASRAALPGLRRPGGAIVNVGAASAVKAAAGMGSYAASKAGVARLTESLSEELKDLGNRVNAILPSIIDTPANRADMPDADFGRWPKPEELAEVVAFLLSEQASAVTGALLPVVGRV